MKRLLLISYYFPPEGGAGTQRCAKFAKYLSEFGWQPVVLTRAPAGLVSDFHTEDRSLLKDVGSDIRIVRVPAEGDPVDWARSVPPIDTGRNWLEPALREAGNIVSDAGGIDAVFVSMSPFDLSELGLRIGQKFDVPVAMDLRDPWALDGWRLRGTFRRWKQDFEFMQRVLPKADGVVANTAEARRQLLTRIAGLNEERVVTIPNGFDEADFSNLPQRPSLRREAMRICHLGTLHSAELYRYQGPLGWMKRMRHHRPEPIDVSGRTPVHLLRALRLLRERGEIKSDVQVQLIGSDDPETRRCVRESGVADLVEISGYTSHDAAIERLLAADVLFAPLHGLPQGRRSVIVPGKIYEYLRTGRPMLGCLPEGDARDLVERAGWPCANPCDSIEIAQAIKQLHERWRAGTLESASTRASWLDQFERRTLTRRLANFLDQIAGYSTQPMVVREPAESAAHG